MRLPTTAADAIDQHRPPVFVRAASAWEIATKVRRGKLPGAAAIAADIPGVIVKEGFQPLSLTIEHGQRAGGLPRPLRDPFDRMLAAQSMVESVPLVTKDARLQARDGLRTIW